MLNKCLSNQIRKRKSSWSERLSKVSERLSERLSFFGNKCGGGGRLNQHPETKHCLSTLAAPWDHLGAFTDSDAQAASQVSYIRLSLGENSGICVLQSSPGDPRVQPGKEPLGSGFSVRVPITVLCECVGPGSPAGGVQGPRARTEPRSLHCVHGRRLGAFHASHQNPLSNL